MASPQEFQQRMASLAAKVQDNADKTVRKVAMAVDQTVVMATPVDTGRARANWIAALDVGVTNTVETLDPSGGQAIAQAAGVIAGYKGKPSGRSEIHVTNNLAYIGSLNDGSSRQAPKNFVQQAVKAGAAAVKGAKLLEG